MPSLASLVKNLDALKAEMEGFEYDEDQSDDYNLFLEISQFIKETIPKLKECKVKKDVKQVELSERRLSSCITEIETFKEQEAFITTASDEEIVKLGVKKNYMKETAKCYVFSKTDIRTRLFDKFTFKKCNPLPKDVIQMIKDEETIRIQASIKMRESDKTEYETILAKLKL
jgi:hypothetical protein